MKKIFLDVGGHLGQTLQEITKPNYHFDTIYCFEPMPVEFAHLRSVYGSIPNLEILNYGLANSTGPRNVYGTNADMGASIYNTKADLDDPETFTQCMFMRSSEFFESKITQDDLVVMKLNCEGAEAIILNDLLDTGQIDKIDNVMIDFDVRKIPELVIQERIILERFKKIGFSRFSLAEDVMRGPTHQNRIRNWIFSLSFHAQITDLF